MNDIKGPIKGLVVDMDISHMRAAVVINYDGEEFTADVKVGTIYDIGEEINVYDVMNCWKPWYLQGTEFIDANPICEAEVMHCTHLA